MLEHRFGGTPFTVGVEEELMILDGESLDLAQEIEAILDGLPDRGGDRVKPELMQSVLEIATEPCSGVAEAGRQLADLRRQVREIAASHGLLIGASGTHPFARWDRQLIVERPRYRELAAELGFIAWRELIFGTHVHVGVDDPDKAIYVADGIRPVLPLMLAASANSPFWQGRRTGMLSARTPVFRAFPRVGIPPYFGNWEVFTHRVELLMKTGAIDDYTYLWWDVRPHPNLGTVEVRVFDQQTKLEHTIAFAALVQCVVHKLAALFDEGVPMIEEPFELIDDNKVRAAMRGLGGELSDFKKERQVPAGQMLTELVDGLRDDAEALGCAAELAGIDEMVADGPEAKAQIAQYESENDLKTLVETLVDGTEPT